MPPVPARDAATVMLVRDEADGLEVCMLRRHLDSDFVGGAYVFPGGKVDDADRSELARTVCAGRTDLQASELLGIDEGGLAFFVAALRECFEEAGILLAYPAGATGGDLYRPSDDAAESRLARFRAEVNAKRVGFLEACERARVLLAVDRVLYFSHWITPEPAPKRFDTRFFVACVPPGQTAIHDDYETVETVWIRPREALDRNDAGEFDLIFPTVKNLEAISRFSTSDALLAAAAAVEHVPAVLPRVISDGHGARIVLPGDPDYENAVGTWVPAPSGLTPDEVQAAVKSVSSDGRVRRDDSARSGDAPGATPISEA
ncbi:MAG: NUDIX hydrolase [Acidimicrobiales bacterium]